MGNRIAPSLEMVTAYNTQAYEVFMSVRAVQYRESQEAIANFRAQLAEVMRVENAVAEMHGRYPELLATAHVARVLTPIKREYVGILERTLAQIERKQTQLEALRNVGQALSIDIAELMELLRR